MTDKPIVKYRQLVYVRVGHAAVVAPLDHPSPWVTGDGETLVETSTVLAINADGSFETLNTRYEPEALDPSDELVY